jgi:adenine-specific DNA-methyltransferase
MKLTYSRKKSKTLIRDKKTRGFLKEVDVKDESPNKLIIGDNLGSMKCLLHDYHYKKKIDLVYIDPPFSTNNNFLINGDRATTISSSKKGELAYSDKLKGQDFIEFLRERLLVLYELMSDRASIYLHIDYKVGHYVKVMMDEIFGIENFRNDITRIKCNPKNFRRKGYGNIKDLILFYSKSDDFTFNEPRTPHTKDDIDRLFKKVDEQGRRYTTIPVHAPGETISGKGSEKWKGMSPPIGRHWRISPKELEVLDDKGLIEWSKNNNPRQIVFAEDRIKKGKYIQDIWEYKDPQYPKYPTEKNKKILDLIIKTSSNEGDLVMDCFAGSGTTLVSAISNNRNWIGIDSSEKSIPVIKNRILDLDTGLFEDRSFQYLEHQNNQ